MNALGIITLVAGSSVLAALVTKGLDLWGDGRKRRVEADFAALYLAIALEDYASKCTGIIADISNHLSSRGEMGESHGNLAPLPEYPENIDWKAFGIRPATKAMSFRIEVDAARESISSLWDFDEDDAFALVSEYAASLGSKALSLAMAFRRSRGIEPVDYSGDWSAKAFLEKKSSEFADAKQRREAAAAASYSEMGLVDDTAT